MTKETYVRAIVRNLRLPHKTKRRIKNDLLNAFIVRMEAGESQEQIIADMGAPEKVAAEFHENFSDQLLPQRTALDWILFIGGIFFGVLALWQVIDSFLFPALLHAMMGNFDMHSAPSGDIAIIGGADGPTSIFVAGSFNLVALLVPLLLCGICIAFYLWHRKRERSSRG